MRDTKTDINHEKYYHIKDFWTTDLRDGRQELPDEWIGTTTFDSLRPDPGPNKVWIDGRLTILHSDTQRPGHKHPDEWALIKSKKAQRLAQAEWAIEGPRRDKERELAGKMTFIPHIDMDDFNDGMN